RAELRHRAPGWWHAERLGFRPGDPLRLGSRHGRGDPMSVTSLACETAGAPQGLGWVAVFTRCGLASIEWTGAAARKWPTVVVDGRGRRWLLETAASELPRRLAEFEDGTTADQSTSRAIYAHA